MNDAFLITGTDTGVGKTFVAAGLARVFREDGTDVGVMKPAETDHRRTEGPWPADAKILVEAAGCDDPPELVVPFVFEPPVAPLVGARRAGQPIDPDRIADAFRQLRARHELLIVEGAGGLAVPLAEPGQGSVSSPDRPFDYADLARALGTGLLVVARAHLGTLNHTALTVECARQRGVPVIGVVLNGLDAGLDDPSAADNPAMIEEICRVPVLGLIPRLDGQADIAAAAAAVREHLDLDALRTRIAD